MILAEKIMSLRKKNGWSQEDLAQQLNVSRQSVSKWESNLSIPDIDKIVKMSQIFSVSTDYLLKETKEDIESINELESIESSLTTSDNNLIERNTVTVEQVSKTEKIPVSLELANEFLDLKEKIAKHYSIASFLCVLSPILLIVLAGFAEDNKFNISEGFAAGAGILTVLGFVAIAAVIFIIDGMKESKYEYLEKENLDLQYGVEAIVTRKSDTFDHVNTIGTAIGVVLSIISVVPLLVCAFIGTPDYVYCIDLGILLLIISFAVIIFVRNGVIKESYQILLQQEDFTPEGKLTAKTLGPIPGIYWTIISVIFLGYSFKTNNWQYSWIIWLFAGMLYVLIMHISKSQIKKKNNL